MSIYDQAATSQKIPESEIPVSPDVFEKDTTINQTGHFKEFWAGAGSTIFKINKEGIFAGSEDFATAPIQITYDGIIRLGSTNLILDGVNKRIVLNDGTTNRVVIGNL